jgi:hypothetical protein
MASCCFGFVVHFLLFAIWLLTLLVLAVWTLAAAQLAALLFFGGDWLVQFVPLLTPLLSRMLVRLQTWLLPVGNWLQTWWPTWQDAALWALEVLQSFLAWVGATAPMMVWLAWAFGTALLLSIASGLSLLVKLFAKMLASPPEPDLDLD